MMEREIQLNIRVTVVSKTIKHDRGSVHEIFHKPVLDSVRNPLEESEKLNEVW